MHAFSEDVLESRIPWLDSCEIASSMASDNKTGRLARVAASSSGCSQHKNCSQASSMAICFKISRCEAKMLES